jgi:hypothetical protein
MQNEPNTPGDLTIRIALALIVGIAAGLFLAANPFMPFLGMIGVVVVAAVIILALLLWRR